MSEEGQSPAGDPSNDDETRHHQVQVPGVTARVPSTLGHGVISTGAIVMNGPHVFVLDFLQQMGVPSNLVRRVVLPHAVVPRFIQALEQNLGNFEQKFGAPAKLPRPPQPPKRPTIQEIYDNIKSGIAFGGESSVNTTIVKNRIHSGRIEGIFIMDSG